MSIFDKNKYFALCFYTGTAKVTEFKKTTTEDGTVQVDSTKYYVDVEINFHGTDYDKYTVNVYRNEEK